MLDKSLIGRRTPTCTYRLSAEKIEEYAKAIGDLNPVYLDEGAAREAAFPTIVAPPAAAAVFALKPMEKLLLESEDLPIDLAKLLHGEQEYEFHRPILAGTRFTIQGEIKDVYQKGNMSFLVVELVSSDEEERPVVTARTTLIVREG